VQEKRFPELTAEKTKLKIKRNRTTNSAELIKSKRIGASLDDI
jgi:hypothetical protein